MKPAFVFLLTLSFALVSINPCFAQDAKTFTLQPPPKNMAVNGDIKAWGDSLPFYNNQQHINYAIANSKDTLYMAVRVNDRLDQQRILHAGLTFSIDPRGKKKETFSITFPLNVQGGSTPVDSLHNDAPTEISPQEREDLMLERVTSLRGIKVIGFKEVEDEMITTSNTYGFQTAVNYDQKGYLVCEAAIPMSFFHDENPAQNEWAFNFKFNGVGRKLKAERSDTGNPGGHGGGRGGGISGGGAGGGGHRGGHGGGNHGPDAGGNSEVNRSEDFWVKYYLAK